MMLEKYCDRCGYEIDDGLGGHTCYEGKKWCECSKISKVEGKK